MVTRGGGKWVVWPHYFDRNLSRAQGRRVPADLAIEDPRVGHIANAARTLGLKPEIDEAARPPGLGQGQPGRILVPKGNGESKESVLKQIARRL